MKKVPLFIDNQQLQCLKQGTDVWAWIIQPRNHESIQVLVDISDAVLFTDGYADVKGEE